MLRIAQIDSVAWRVASRWRASAPHSHSRFMQATRYVTRSRPGCAAACIYPPPVSLMSQVCLYAHDCIWSTTKMEAARFGYVPPTQPHQICSLQLMPAAQTCKIFVVHTGGSGSYRFDIWQCVTTSVASSTKSNEPLTANTIEVAQY
jgi:hypothetical protein